MTLFKNITGTIEPNGGDPKMRWDKRKKCFSVSKYSRDENKYVNVPIKEDFLMDFGSARHGWERFKKGKAYSLVLVSITEDVPELPDDDFVAVGAIGAIVPSIGRVELLVENEDVSKMLSDIFDAYEKNENAAAGLIPKVNTHTSRGTTDWYICGWEERREQVLGVRLVPVPNIESQE